MSGRRVLKEGTGVGIGVEVTEWVRREGVRWKRKLSGEMKAAVEDMARDGRVEVGGLRLVEELAEGRGGVDGAADGEMLRWGGDRVGNTVVEM